MTFEINTPHHTDLVTDFRQVVVHFPDGITSDSIIHASCVESFVEEKIRLHGPESGGSKADMITSHRPAWSSSKLFECSQRSLRWVDHEHHWDAGFAQQQAYFGMATELRILEQELRQKQGGLRDRRLHTLVQVRIEYLNGKDAVVLIDERDCWRLLHSLLRADEPEQEKVAAVSYCRIDESRDAQRKLQVETGEVEFEWQEHLLWMHPRRQQEQAVSQTQEDCYECLEQYHPTCEICGGITSMHPDYPATGVEELARCTCGGETMVSLLLRPLDELEFSVRTANCLMALFGNTGKIWQLLQMTEAKLLRTPRFGRKSLKEVKEMLDNLGFRLGMKLDEKLIDHLQQTREDLS